MILGALIDLDGTLVDTAPFLYQVYLDFLKERGVEGSQEEFKSLQGPTLKEVVAILAERYQFPGDPKKLVESYLHKIQEGGGELLPGVLEFLKTAQANRVRLGVVTSAPKAWAEAVLLKLGVLSYFRFILSAEEVDKGKPSPDVYFKGIQTINLPPEKLIAVEDTPAGFKAAEGAGLKTYLPDWKALTELLLDSYFPTLIQAPVLNIAIAQAPRFEEREEKLLESNFKRVQAENPGLFNGTVYFYQGHTEDTLSIFRGDYSLFLGRKLLKKRTLWPVAVSGLTTCRERVLWGKRALRVTTYGGFWETVPSGGLADPDPFNQLINELEEEAHITADNVLNTHFLGVVHNVKEEAVEILYRLQLSREEASPSEEVSELLWLGKDKSPPYSALPLSIYLSTLKKMAD